MDQQSFIYNFLLSPRFRILRYLSILIFFVIVSLNQALMSYAGLFPALGHKIDLIILATVLIYIGIMFLTSRVFIPRLLLKGKYLLFAACILVDALIFTLVPNIVYMLYFDNPVFFTTIALIDNLSAFVVYVLCIAGVFTPIFLKSWMISNQQLNRLKVKQALSLVGQLKEQINPASFFKILKKSESLIRTEPGKASAMLMKLSQLLRYQLYDCNRDKVLLTAELSFLENFLYLEQLYSSQLNYTVTADNNLTNIFIPPSLLLPYVQGIVNALDYTAETCTVDISVNDTGRSISILLSVSGIKEAALLDQELAGIRERFGILYRNKYELAVISNEHGGNVEIGLQLDKE